MTTTNKTTLAVLAATLCGGHQIISPAPALASPPGPRTATIEVVRLAPGGGKRTMSFTMSLGEDRRPSRLKVSSDGTFYRINISHEKQKGNTTVVHLDLRCDEHRPAASRATYWRAAHRSGKGARRARRRSLRSSTDVSVSSRLTVGRRTLLSNNVVSSGMLRPSAE